MADQIKKVDYFVMDVADKPGQGARILKALSQEGVNLLAFTGFPNGKRAQLDFLPRDVAVFKKAVRRAKLKIKTKKTAFLIQGRDRRGAVASVMEKLAAEKINVTACDAVSAGGGRWGAILWVPPADVKKASKALGLKG